MRRRSLVADQRGVAVVMVALSFPIILLFCVLSVDVANWFVHKRHLQTRADAAALAAGGKFSFPNCDNTAIRNKAIEYSGKQTFNAPKPEVTPQSRLHAEINKANYFNQATPGDAGLPADPCDTLYVDVKMTEDNLPWFFGSGLVANINAQARVQLFKAILAEGLLPVGVQDAVPKTVRAWVVNEATGTEIPGSSVELNSLGASGNLQHFANATPVTFNLPATTPERLGVRVALSGSTSTTCGQPLVSCYDSVATTHGLSFIRTYPDPPTLTATAAPQALSVSLSPGDCGNASFNSSTAACQFSVNAKVKWNANATLVPPGTLSTLTLKIDGKNPGHPMTYSAATNTWSAVDLPFTRGAAIGTSAISIEYKQRGGQIGTQNCTGGNRCEGTFGNVQRTFWNVPDDQASQAGPIATFDVLNGSTAQQVSDLHRCTNGVAPSVTHCTASLVYDIKVKGSLELGDEADIPVALRVSENQSQSLECDPGEGGANGLENMMANGCSARYIINTGQACPANASALFSSPQPWACVPIQTGEPQNATAKGLNRRILCNTAVDGANAVNNCNPNGGANDCTHPNRWPRGGPAPADLEGDPRVVDVFVTPFGTFAGTGSETVPVIRAGRFYVTGYTGQGGFDAPCADNSGPGGSDDVYSTYPNDPPSGNISGHFIVGILPNSGGASSETCDLDEVGNCVTVLVK